MKSNLIDLPARLITETEKARLFEFENGRAWIPKSQHEWDEVETVTLPEPLATEKGLV